MGGLFSSERKPKTHSVHHCTENNTNYLRSEQIYGRTSPTSYYDQQRTAPSNNPSRNVNVNRSYAYTTTFSLSSGGNVYSDNNLPLSPSTRTIRSDRVSSKTIISKSDYKRFQQILFNTIIRQSSLLNENEFTSNENYKLVRLTSLSSEYDQIVRKFRRGVGDGIYVNKIERIENQYLLSQYLLKKLEYQNKQLPVEERILFHGTKPEHIDNICKDNFDWRRHGQTKGNIFGKGVSFTPKSTYANHYCDRNNKIMIVVKVLVSNACEGHRDMTIPDYYNKPNLLRYDTSIKEPKRDVLVKYCDDEFYPVYLIHYEGKMFYPNQGFSR